MLNHSLQDYTSDEDRTVAGAVKRIFSDILDEMDEQGTFFPPLAGVHLNAIEFYTSLCRDSVWQCSSLIESRLRNFGSYLQSCRQQEQQHLV